MPEIPVGFHSQIIKLGKIDIHTIHNGKPTIDGTIDNDPRPALLMLHGFPEYFGAWTPLIPYLSEKYLMIIPDQRGFNLSSCPGAVKDYRTGLLVGDMIGVLDRLLPDQPFHLVGHDWGASVSYAMAMAIPERIPSLTTVNGVHPITFQRALLEDPAQAQASQYFHVLNSPNSAKLMTKNNFEKTFAMFEKFSSEPWLNDSIRTDYTEAWENQERMDAMLNWYRSSPIVVPVPDKPTPPAPLLDMDMAKFVIPMPHLVVWGMEDTALLPSSRAGLDEFASNLRIKEFADAGHWVIHTDPAFIAGHIDDFING